jgi:hypothetical protein
MYNMSKMRKNYIGFAPKLSTLGIDRMYNQASLATAQKGGCGSLYDTGSQAGGLPIIPLLTAAYAGLKAVQPFSKAKKVLEDHVPENKKNSLGFKIGHKIASIGSSLGFGLGESPIGPITYQKGVFQPNLLRVRVPKRNHYVKGGSKAKKQKGAGKRKKRKSIKK